jgi:hypothetical protein
MKKQKSFKLSFIKMLSDPKIHITDFHISIDTKEIPKKRTDKNVSDGWKESEPTGHSTVIIEMYKEPKK